MNAHQIAPVLAAFVAMGAAASAAPTVPYNEAVRLVDGRVVVDTPPVPAHISRPGTPLSRPGAPGVTSARISIETPDGLMDCSTYWYVKDACVPSNFGHTQERREWVVKRGGKWQACVGRAVAKQCKGLQDFAFLPVTEE